MTIEVVLKDSEQFHTTIRKTSAVTSFFPLTLQAINTRLICCYNNKVATLKRLLTEFAFKKTTSEVTASYLYTKLSDWTPVDEWLIILCQIGLSYQISRTETKRAYSEPNQTSKIELLRF